MGRGRILPPLIYSPVNTSHRCPWATAPPEYRRYHDEEWGRPVTDDGRIFEKLCLEGFQAGLSWLTILRKRGAFRAAFAGFDPAAVAGFGPDDVTRLLADAGIVRNRAKIEATIANARATVAVRHPPAWAIWRRRRRSPRRSARSCCAGGSTSSGRPPSTPPCSPSGSSTTTSPGASRGRSARRPGLRSVGPSAEGSRLSRVGARSPPTLPGQAPWSCLPARWSIVSPTASDSVGCGCRRAATSA